MVIEICKILEAKQYWNAIGGMELYSNSNFKANDLELVFLKSGKIEYKQFTQEFVPNLSILDVLMFNSKETVKEYLSQYTLIQNAGDSRE